MSVFESLSTPVQTIITVIALVYYVAQCLFGYKLFKITCAFIGFITGFTIGLMIGVDLVSLETVWAVVLGAAVGIVLALLAVKLFLLGVFLIGFSLAFSLAIRIPFPDTGNWHIFAIIIAVAIGVIVGMLAVRFAKPVIIIYTGASGAFNAVATFSELTGYISSERPMYFAIIGIMAAIGIIVQFISNRK